METWSLLLWLGNISMIPVFGMNRLSFPSHFMQILELCCRCAGIYPQSRTAFYYAFNKLLTHSSLLMFIPSNALTTASRAVAFHRDFFCCNQGLVSPLILNSAESGTRVGLLVFVSQYGDHGVWKPLLPRRRPTRRSPATTGALLSLFFQRRQRCIGVFIRTKSHPWSPNMLFNS